MKIIACADLHIRSTIPINRIDDVPQVVRDKIKFIIDKYLK